MVREVLAVPDSVDAECQGREDEDDPGNRRERDHELFTPWRLCAVDD